MFASNIGEGVVVGAGVVVLIIGAGVVVLVVGVRMVVVLVGVCVLALVICSELESCIAITFAVGDVVIKLACL